MFFIFCIVLGVFFFGLFIIIVFIFLKVKGKYGRCRVLGVTGKVQGWEKVGFEVWFFQGDSSKYGSNLVVVSQFWFWGVFFDGKDFFSMFSRSGLWEDQFIVCMFGKGVEEGDVLMGKVLGRLGEGKKCFVEFLRFFFQFFLLWRIMSIYLLLFQSGLIVIKMFSLLFLLKKVGYYLFRGWGGLGRIRR